MSIKSIVAVILISIIIGAGIYFSIAMFKIPQPSLISQTTPTSQTPQPTSTPLPTPNPITINEKSNLKEEINKLKVPDFAQDFKELKNSLN